MDPAIAERKPVLKQIDILVYPLWKFAEELKTPQGKRKFEQWLKQIKLSAKNKETAFVIVHDLKYAEKSAFDTKLRDYLGRFAHERFVVLPVQKAFRVFLNFGFLNFIKKSFVLEGAVEIRRYGQHARMCVEGMGATLSRELAIKLTAQGIKVKEKAVDGLSLKKPGYYSLSRAEEIFPKMSGVEKEALRDELFELRKRGAFHAVRVAHAFKKSESAASLAKRLSRMKKRV